MKTTFISTRAISETTRQSLMKLQSKLSAAQKEVTTGRHADVGASLGFKTSQTVSLRQEHARLKAITETNSVAATRLDVSQAALKGMVDNAQAFVSELIGARNSEGGAGVVQGQAQSALKALMDSMNTAFGDAYVFAGINADVKPITDYYENPAPANRQAVANAFLTTFGMPQSAPGLDSIPAASMQAFLDTTFAGLFSASDWSATWSAASDQNVRSRISTSEVVETSTNANEEAMRKLANAYSMVADLGVENLNQGAFEAVVDTAIRVAGESIQALTKLQSSLGTSEERIANANERMSIQIDIMTNHINVLETVDPYEASTRVAQLLTQIETAYAMTAQIQQLSILNYL